jgi:NADH-quinone oxidoreductase subunit J
VLTLRDRRSARHQIIRMQNSRTVAETLEMVPVSLGANVNTLGIYRPKVAEPEEVLADETDSEALLGHHGGGGHGGGGAHHAPEVR